MGNKITAKEIIALIRKLPDAESHIFIEKDGKISITQEWLCGSFAGRCFTSESLDGSANEMIDYLYRHIGHDSMVGKSVTDSGFPDLEKVEKYCRSYIKSELKNEE